MQLFSITDTGEQIQRHVLSILARELERHQLHADRETKAANHPDALPRDHADHSAWAEVSTRYADAFQVALRAAEMAFQAKAPTVETTVDELCRYGFPAQAERIKDGEPGTIAMVIEWVASVAPNHRPEDYADSPRALNALCALWLVMRGKMPQPKAEAAEVTRLHDLLAQVQETASWCEREAQRMRRPGGQSSGVQERNEGARDALTSIAKRLRALTTVEVSP